MNQFRKFNQDALDAYVQWVKENHEVELKMQDVPDIPSFAQMLSGTPDAIAENPNGGAWPVMVKTVWQSTRSQLKSIEELAGTRNNFYLEKQNGKWKVKPSSTVYYACQNIMMMYGYENMDLICYSEHNKDLLIVGVELDKQDFILCLESLKDFLQQGAAFFFKNK
jgi:hypothetical protein